MKSRYLQPVLSFLVICVLVSGVATITGCGTTPEKNSKPESDDKLEAANRLARFAFDNGEYQQAADLYQSALDRAYLRDDATAILDARYNMAVCLLELEKYAEALTTVHQTKEEMAFKGLPKPPEIYLLEATILYRSGRLDDSWRTTEEILANRNIGSPLIGTKTYFLRGLISSHRNDVAGMQDAINSMGQPQNAIVKSDLSELRGRLAMAENQWDQAIVLFDEATVYRRENFDYRRMAMTQALSAEVCQKAGKTDAAASRYFQAGRSAALRGDQANARLWLTQANQLFQQIGNDALAAESRALIADISGEAQ
jgi:tetratricopeptide (TPR) repeat protein